MIIPVDHGVACPGSRRGGEPGAVRVTTPGDLLVILLKHRGMTQAELATLIDRPAQAVSEIATGRKRVTAHTAVQFEGVFGLPARIWLSLQNEVDLEAAGYPACW